MIHNIAQHEYLKLLRSGKIWKLLALCQFILSLIFYWLMEEFSGKTQQFLLEKTVSLGNITEEVIHPLFAWTALFFFFITPLLATNMLTQERKNKTLDLYLTTSISPAKIILGKLLGAWYTQCTLLLPLLTISIFLFCNYTVDFGQWCTALLGLTLLLSTTLSLGMFVSSLSQEPIVCALAVFIALAILTLLEWIASSSSLTFLAEFSLLYHCKDFLSGLLSTRSIIYYFFTASLFIGGSIFQLKKAYYAKRCI